jgi:hypothetical protein
MSFIPVMFSGRPHLTSPKERNKAQPSLSETLYSIGVFENVEQKASSRPSPKEKATNTQPSLFGNAVINRSLRKCWDGI